MAAVQTLVGSGLFRVLQPSYSKRLEQVKEAEMTHTELLTNHIEYNLTNNKYMDIDTFRDMFIHGFPGKLAFLAISRDANKVLPIFDPGLHTMEMVDYGKVRTVLGNDWIPVLSAHLWNRVPGDVPRTLLTIDGIVDEKVLHGVFGTVPQWTTVGAVQNFDFGCFDVKTLPPLAMYTIDRIGARRILTMNKTSEGKVRDVQLDVRGYIRYLEIDTNKVVMARLDIDRADLDWRYFDL